MKQRTIMDQSLALEKEVRSVGKLTLRAIEPEDVEFLLEIENDEQIMEFTDRVAPLSRQSLKTYVMQCDPDPYSSGQLRLVVAGEDGTPIGLLDFYDISLRHKRSMVGIGILPGFRGLGLASRILEMAKAFASRRLRLDTLAAMVSENNIKSLKAFSRAGFEEVGHLKKWWTGSDGPEDCLIMQVR